MPSLENSGLPIDEVLPELRRALREHSSAVLTAPPGAGKSTVVPLMLAAEPWAAGKRILMLEPRRLAARAVAVRMAETFAEAVGRTVGYRMRLDTKVSRETRIEVVTEGVLTRMLQSDPALEGVAAVVFDEYHERSLQADLGLALVLDARESVAPDLRILVMSATLEGAAVSRLLGDAPVVAAHGRSFPVQTRYAGKGAPPLPDGAMTRGAQDSPEALTARIVRRALQEQTGDVLVFLPGAREIQRVRALLEGSASPSGASALEILPLYGELSGEEQAAALTPGGPGIRRIVLATNIAETSLTIPGVRVVVDSGLVRRLRFDPATGMSRLETERISRASADQRQGRAGRVAAGVCYRAWSESAQRSLAPFSPAEIVEADLTPLALELASWGVRDAAMLKWLDAPPAATLASARELLGRLGALDGGGRITPHGREMARLAVHPRLAHMLLRARERGSLPLAADLAALLSERDLLRASTGARDADIRGRLEALRGETEPAAIDRAALPRARRAARELLRQLGAGRALQPDRAADSAGGLLALAFPDRIGRQRSAGEGRFILTNGRGAHFAEPQGLSRQELIVAVDLDDRERDARIRLAAPLRRGEVEELMAARLERSDSVEWSTREQAVLARRVLRLDGLVLEESALPEVPQEASRAAMLEGIRQLGIGSLPWSREARDLQARVAFVRALDEAHGRWPDLSDTALAQSVGDWLPLWLDGITRRDHLARIPLLDALLSRLSWDERRELDTLAPSHLTVPSGSRVRIDYLDESAPAVSVRLQEVFGLTATPRIGAGRVPLTFKLLSPAQRPVQVTRDLASFWRGAYSEVRKDLRGRYPKHYWPENPLEGEPTQEASARARTRGPGGQAPGTAGGSARRVRRRN
ncbi:MAG TPA: ATP-dependent helicase HrpB [Steroidobacteraceae bacterium]|nr:ATP-dependent helicase HrpB [Steroidobacteraceae bacterium]